MHAEVDDRSAGTGCTDSIRDCCLLLAKEPRGQIEALALAEPALGRGPVPPGMPVNAGFVAAICGH
jgi:hypothetical protein